MSASPRHTTLVLHFLRYYRGHAWWVLLAIVTIPIYGATSAGIVALIEPIFEDVLLAGESPGAIEGVAFGPSSAPSNGESGLKALADQGYDVAKSWAGVDEQSVVFFTPMLLLAVFFLRGVANFWGRYAFQRIGLGITTEIRNDLHARFLDQSARFHARFPSGELLSRTVNDVTLMQSALSTRLFDLVQQSLTLVLLLGLLLSTNLTLTLAVLVAAPLFLLTIVGFGRAVRRSSGRSQARMAEWTTVLTEGLRGHEVVKAFGAERYEGERFQAATSRYFDVARHVRWLQNLSPLVVESLAVTTTSLFLIYAGLGIRSGQLAMPRLIQFIANVWLLYEPIRKLNGANLVLQQMAAVGQRVFELMTAESDVTERPDARRIEGFHDRIVFDRVTVRYGTRTVLDDVSLDIPRGARVAIVGPSGAGKTTLVSLLPRFFDPDEGRVLVDGHDVRDLTIQSLRSLVGLVTQQTVLFDDTIRANIAYGRLDVPLEDIQAAASAAVADAFIRAKPDGYDSRIGELGLRLSGGERQRLAIARALVKNAPILILDEATSQLDRQARALVHDALLNLMRGRTVLVIAHDLSTAEHADRIIVLDQGKVMAVGCHADLAARDPTYQRLLGQWTARARPEGPGDHRENAL